MFRIIIFYGLLAGLIVSAIMAFGTTSMMQKDLPETIMYVVGFGSMLLAFSMMFFAVRRYRNELPGQQIGFWKAFNIAFWVAFICAVCYTITWVIVYKNFFPNYMTEYSNKHIEAMRKAGKSAAEILKEQKEMASMKEMYDTWPGLIGMTMMEILPVGIVVAFICAFVYSRKRRVDFAQSA
jgi:hypothetical protein